jgi:hypothetical protein
MKHKLNVRNSAKNRQNLWEFSKKKIQILISNDSRVINFFNESLQPRFFAKKMTGQK